MKAKFLGLTFGVLLAVMSVSPGTWAQDPTGEPIRIGVLQPLTGECTVWGIPATRGAEMYVEMINASGGLLVKGKRHKIDFKAYDNNCYTPTDELKMATKAVLEDKRQYLFGTYTYGARRATAPLSTREKVMVVGYGSAFLSKEFPYTISGETGIPVTLAPTVGWVANKHPEIKKVAIICADEWPEARAWYEAGCKAAGLDIVYNELYPTATADYKPLMTAVMATKPDLICEHGTPAGGSLLEAAKLVGYNGFWIEVDWDAPSMLKRVPADYFEGKVYSGTQADYADPIWPDKFGKVYQAYIDKHGKQEWAPNAGSVATSIALIVEVGIPAAGSVEPSDVLNSLMAMQEVDHPVYGKSKWGGKEIWGADLHLFTPVPIQAFQKGGGGVLRGIDKASMSDWWDANRTTTLEILSKYNLLYKEK